MIGVLRLRPACEYTDADENVSLPPRQNQGCKHTHTHTYTYTHAHMAVVDEPRRKVLELKFRVPVVDGIANLAEHVGSPLVSKTGCPEGTTFMIADGMPVQLPWRTADDPDYILSPTGRGCLQKLSPSERSTVPAFFDRSLYRGLRARLPAGFADTHVTAHGLDLGNATDLAPSRA